MKITSNGTVWFEEYSWRGMTPFYQNKWYLDGWRSLEEVANLCQIPDDEAIVLKLQYGG